MSFLVTSWRKGRTGAVIMGLHHGLFCVGCCWALMGLLFVAGVMNVLWVGAIAAFVFIEKIVPRGDLIGRFVGVPIVGAGIWVIFLGFTFSG